MVTEDHFELADVRGWVMAMRRRAVLAGMLLLVGRPALAATSKWDPHVLAEQLEGKFIIAEAAHVADPELTDVRFQNAIVRVRKASASIGVGSSGLLLSVDGLFTIENPEGPHRGELSAERCGRDLPGAALRLFVPDEDGMVVIDEDGSALVHDTEVRAGSKLGKQDLEALHACTRRLDRLQRSFPLERIELGAEGGPPKLTLVRNSGTEHVIRLSLEGPDWEPTRIALEPRAGSAGDYAVEWQAVLVIQCSAEGPHSEFWEWETRESPWWPYARAGRVFRRNTSSTESVPYGFTPDWRERFRTYLERLPAPQRYGIDECSPETGAFRYRIRKGKTVLKQITVFQVMGC